ncbi:uncharacterized protein MYCGRDRAFT_95024 [Zymoseptoria tritici IPO323]|uniref:IBR domain-containing protein n=1 Tax=Zymoseptoria tritici (strain CBS 115943 / IPO323) TaxID=336722 RepID=F9XGX5_ZYMTI|nr:uncharacterized protein MYCGRDRAFT_95024 [Zymoseptoria tritici IPO323]EGP84932.1 hypothetical protein MYCGRDRAFT_95024 [Zymoseptoria tritici IPO323]
MSAPPPPPPPAPPRWQCKICWEDDVDDKTFIVNDPMCKDCIRVHAFERALKLENKFPPQWEGELVDMDDFRHLPDDDYMRRYERRVFELSFPVPERIYCGHPDRGRPEPAFFIGQRQPDTDQVCHRCSICGQYACMTCGKIVTENGGGQEEKIQHDCNPHAEEEFQAQSLSSVEIGVQYQECPNVNCQRPLNKDGGCNEVACECGTHYCYTCGVELQPPYADHWDWYGGGCQQSGPRRRRSSEEVSFDDGRSGVLPQTILQVAGGAPAAWHSAAT